MYGANRVGKTTLAAGFRKPLLCVSFEPPESGGCESIRKVDGVTCLVYGEHFQTLVEVMKIAEELREGGMAGLRTLVLDSATSLQDMVLKEILNLPAIPDQMSWGMVSPDQYRDRAEKTKSHLRPFLDLLDKGQAAEFLGEAGQRLKAAYPPVRGVSLLPFVRLFFVATHTKNRN